MSKADTSPKPSRNKRLEAEFIRREEVRERACPSGRFLADLYSKLLEFNLEQAAAPPALYSFDVEKGINLQPSTDREYINEKIKITGTIQEETQAKDISKYINKNFIFPNIEVFTKREGDYVTILNESCQKCFKLSPIIKVESIKGEVVWRASISLGGVEIIQSNFAMDDPGKDPAKKLFAKYCLEVLFPRVCAQATQILKNFDPAKIEEKKRVESVIKEKEESITELKAQIKQDLLASEAKDEQVKSKALLAALKPLNNTSQANPSSTQPTPTPPARTSPPIPPITEVPLLKFTILSPALSTSFQSCLSALPPSTAATLLSSLQPTLTINKRYPLFAMKIDEIFNGKYALGCTLKDGKMVGSLVAIGKDEGEDQEKRDQIIAVCVGKSDDGDSVKNNLMQGVYSLIKKVST